MPIMFSYDVRQTDDTDKHDHDFHRLQSMMERLGWQRVGGSCYRYPPLGESTDEDWLNQVVPALMLFRAYVLKRRLRLDRYTLEAHSSTGHIEHKLESRQATPTDGTFGQAKLTQWLDDVTQAVPYP